MHRILASGLLSAAVAGGAVLAASAPASAQTPQTDCYAALANCTSTLNPPNLPTDPLPVTVHPGDTPAAPAATPTPDSPATVNQQPVATSSLAFTGIDAAGVAGVGLLLIGGGTILVRTSRRRPTA